MDPSPVRKRSIELGGKTTSISLEEEFWQEMQAIVQSRGMTMERLVTEIDTSRTHHNLSSALRIYVLRWTKEQGRQCDGAPAPKNPP
jgi:predicted DNA-binding ribbon-helix-helix protein